MKEQQSETPLLIAYEGPLGGMSWPINNKLTIGRDSRCNIVIDDRQVSRWHAEIKINDQQEIFVNDLESKNGTYVNGVLIDSGKELHDGDEVKIALIQRFVFVSSDATISLEKFPLQEKRGTKEKKLLIDLNARRIWIGDKELSPPLSVSQYNLLQLLYKNEGTVVGREEIINTVWGKEEAIGVSDQAIDALVRRLRYRLKKTDPTHEYIVTVRGVGFMFENASYER